MIFEQCKENKRFINVKALIIKFVLFFLVLEVHKEEIYQNNLLY